MPGKTAVITGATSGIGAAFAEALARQGFDLFLTGRRRERIEEVAGYLRERHDVSVQVSIVELSDIRQVDRLIEEIAAIPVISYLDREDHLPKTRRLVTACLWFTWFPPYG